MSTPSRSSRIPLLMGLVGVFLVMGLSLAFVIGLLRTQERERAAPTAVTATVGHWEVLVVQHPTRHFDVTLRHLETSPSAPPTVTLSMPGMTSTRLAVQPLVNGSYAASGSLSMQANGRLIVEDGDSTAEIPLPAPG